MMLISILLLILIVGMLVYALASNPKVARLGEIAYACSLLAICFQLGNKLVSLFGHS